MSRMALKKGVYALYVRVPRKLALEIGKLGKRELDPGVYVYVGSALNSLPGRVSRYLRRPRKKHWHIDYLLDETSASLTGVAWKTTSQRVECYVSRKISSRAIRSVNGFGCSDCDCASHLHYFRLFREAMRVLSLLGFQFSRRASFGAEKPVFRSPMLYSKQSCAETPR